jgi:hypothetical protein
MKFFLLILTSLSLTCAAQNSNRKNVVLSICKKYVKADVGIINQSSNAVINTYLSNSENLKDYIFDIPTVVHECYHNYLSNSSHVFSGSIINFVIDDSLAFKIPNFKTFPSKELVGFIPKNTAEKIFRFPTYINSNEKLLSTQQFGILGLLDEYTAYYHSFKTSVALYGYIQENFGWGDTNLWLTYLQKISSYRYAMDEFTLFISWYIQYAKLHHKQVYNSIITNKNLKQLFQFLNTQNQQLTQLYNLQRADILTHLKGKAYIEGDYLYNTKTLSGVGLGDEKCTLMKTFLQQPEHAILNQLLQ